MAIYSTTHDLWRFFWHSIELQKKSSIAHFFISHEMDEPHRWSKSLILRLPLSERGLVVGFWRKEERTEDEAILASLGRRMDLKEFTDTERVNIRRNIIRKQYPAEDQALLVEALDL